jgi:hypothetical protein
MQFKLATDIAALAAYLPKFLILVEGDLWKKRAVQLARDAMRSPAHAKIVADYHWLESALSTQMTIQTVAAMHFAGMIVETYGRLSAFGRRALRGRLRSALQAETGFAALYLEMDIGLRLMNEGYDVEFPDLEGTARFDIQFLKSSVEGEVECKSLSADAGRKIHRKDFYRFVEQIIPILAGRAEQGSDEILLITLVDRLPRDLKQKAELQEATRRLANEVSVGQVRGSFFRVVRESYFGKIGKETFANEREFYNRCCDVFGKDIHVTGAVTSNGTCLVVMRSQQEDDHSKPWLEATEKAASQFSGKRPAFIAMQFNDIAAADLMLPHLRRHAEILSSALFVRADTSHVAATFFSVFGGLVSSAEGIGAPAFSIINPMCRFNYRPAEFSALLGTVPDEIFAELIGTPQAIVR